MYKMDPYAYHWRWNCYYVNDQERHFELGIDNDDEDNFVFDYTFMGQSKSFDCLDQLRTFATNEVKKELGPKRLSQLFEAGSRGYIGRLEKMFEANVDSKLSSEEINKELAIYFDGNREFEKINHEGLVEMNRLQVRREGKQLKINR